ncbi:PD40 domain-containing protein [Flavobacterium sp. CYK-55]|uniref:PD40 domain-containing protein n=1 Tax=Flavobacterium sp. CYK-55 TaxID=2835529 RepID=UPI001BCA86F9|nr:PD40 domain-containing protein [Flavobacterium sp. CYK-55]MBS7785735.1 PD40 domain-containing protein [Flavobacterium sp. CYK-55]
MKTKISYLILILAFSASAQQVQWANKLIKYSSDLGGKQFGIKRILGKPDAFPQGGLSPNAWTPKNALDGREIVEVSFEKPQNVKQVAVFENVNAGCVVRIALADASGSYQTVWSRKKDWKTPTYKATIPADRNYYFRKKRRKIQDAPELLNPGIENAILDQVYSNITSVKVEFDFSLLPGQKQIDAIGISDSEVLLKAEVNTNPYFSQLALPTQLPFNTHEVSAVALSQDGNKIYFSSYESDKDHVYSATKTGQNWGAAVLEPALSNNDRFNFIESVGTQWMIKGGNQYNKTIGETGFQFYKSSDYSAGEPIKVTAYNNYGDTADATATSDLQTLIMAVESDFTQGGSDLYFAQRKADGSYGMLQSMGKTINSADEEITPQLLPDNRTLLFSSSGFSSYGNYDLYVSYRLDDTWKNWSEPVNLGPIINSDSFESSPFYDAVYQKLYFIKSVNGTLELYWVDLTATELMKK